jgi:hypothetical protein
MIGLAEQQEEGSKDACHGEGPDGRELDGTVERRAIISADGPPGQLLCSAREPVQEE